MSNREVLVVARLPIRSKELRVQVSLTRVCMVVPCLHVAIQAQEKLSAIKKHTLENEPNTNKYAICIPANEDDGTTLWMLEECVPQSLGRQTNVTDLSDNGTGTPTKRPSMRTWRHQSSRIS